LFLRFGPGMERVDLGFLESVSMVPLTSMPVPSFVSLDLRGFAVSFPHWSPPTGILLHCQDPLLCVAPADFLLLHDTRR
jgi:hypothetical protein